jgi:DNA-binding MarR family transcriptional regulator
MNQLRNFGFLLREVSRRYALRFEQHAQAVSMKLQPCKALVYLQRNEGVSQTKLAELSSIEPMAMVRILDQMESEGLVERKPDPNDRRARLLYLTAKSKPTLDEIWRISDLTRGETFAGISKSERDIFLSVLERLHNNLCELQQPTTAGQSQ